MSEDKKLAPADREEEVHLSEVSDGEAALDKDGDK